MIEGVRLKDFRVFENIEILFAEGTNVLLGGNGVGKSSVLEAIMVGLLGWSNRATRARELIRWDSLIAEAYIWGEWGGVRVNVSSQGRIARKSEGLARLPGIVLFSYPDLDIVRGGPQARRNFLNEVLLQIDRQYKNLVLNYNKVLKHRNRLLKDRAMNQQNRMLWDEQLVEFGSRLAAKKIAVLENIEKKAKQLYDKKEDKFGELGIDYKSGIVFNPEDDDKKRFEQDIEEIKRTFFDSLKRTEFIEEKTGFTVVGPHRDDFFVKVDNREAKLYSSQGQTRILSMLLKLAEGETIKEIFRDVVLLLDDVLVELDEGNRSFVNSMFGEYKQQIVTLTDEKQINSLGSEVKIIKMNKEEAKELELVS